MNRVRKEVKYMIFYDTCALLNKLYGAFNERFEISTITFRGDKVYGEVTLVNIYRSRIAQLAQMI